MTKKNEKYQPEKREFEFVCIRSFEQWELNHKLNESPTIKFTTKDSSDNDSDSNKKIN